MGLVVTHTHPGPHGSGDGDSNLGSHRDRQVDEERVARDALGVGPQIAVVLHHLCVDGLRHSLTAHLLLHNTTTLPLTHTHTHTRTHACTRVCVSCRVRKSSSAVPIRRRLAWLNRCQSHAIYRALVSADTHSRQPNKDRNSLPSPRAGTRAHQTPLSGPSTTGYYRGSEQSHRQSTSDCSDRNISASGQPAGLPAGDDVTGRFRLHVMNTRRPTRTR